MKKRILVKIGPKLNVLFILFYFLTFIPNSRAAMCSSVSENPIAKVSIHLCQANIQVGSFCQTLAAWRFSHVLTK